MSLETAIELFLAQRADRIAPGSLALYRRWLCDWQRWRGGVARIFPGRLS